MGKIGLPELNMEFQKKAASAIERSERGIVALLLNDSTQEQAVTVYGNLLEVVKEDWTAANYKYLQYAFKGRPNKVIAIRGIPVTEGTGVDITKSQKLFNCLDYDWFAFPECTAENASALGSFFDQAKKEQYKKWKAVLPDAKADSPAVVNFTTKKISIVWEEGAEVETVTTAAYTARIAGILAGTSLTQSSTYAVLDEVVDAEMPEDADEAIGNGELILIFDGEKWKIGRGVTSLQTISEDMPEDFKKIKIVESSDIFRTDILTTFNDTYVGKYNNTYDNKMMFIGAVLSYMKGVEGILIDRDAGYEMDLNLEKIKEYISGQGKDVSEMTEMQLRKYPTGSKLFLTGRLTFIDAMEDMDMVISM